MALRHAPLALGFLILLPVAAALPLERPVLTVGDEWTYDLLVTEGSVVLEEGEQHVVVVAAGTPQADGTSRTVTLATFENTTLANGTTTTSERLDVYDAQTGEWLASRSGGEEVVPDAPCPGIAYPLEVGDSWTATCTVGGVTSEDSYSVVGGETLAVPAGVFETLSVDRVGDVTARLWFAAESCGKVAEQRLLNDQETRYELTAYRCASAEAAEAARGGATTTTGPTGGTTTTVQTTTTTTTRPTPVVGVPGPALPLVLAALAAGVVLAKRR